VTNANLIGFIAICVFGAAAIIPFFVSALRTGRRKRR
jgi:hypothetical protein